MNPRNPFDSGAKGGILINTTTTQNGDFYAIQIISAAVFTSLIGNLGGDSYTGQTFPPGTVIYGGFTSVQLASGSVIAYNN
jgi:hypothetical protein